MPNEDDQGLAAVSFEEVHANLIRFVNPHEPHLRLASLLLAYCCYNIRAAAAGGQIIYLHSMLYENEKREELANCWILS